MGRSGVRQRAYTLDFKLKVLRRLDELRGNGNATAQEFGVPRQRVYDWKNQRKELESAASRGGKVCHCQLSPRTPEITSGAIHRLECCFICRKPFSGTTPTFVLVQSRAATSQKNLVEVIRDVLEFPISVQDDSSVCQKCFEMLDTIDRLDAELKKLKTTVKSELGIWLDIYASEPAAQKESPESVDSKENCDEPGNVTKYCHKCGKCKSRRKSPQKVKKSVLNFVCEICGKVFRSKGGLKSHVQSHRGEYRHTCQTCGRGFVAKAAYDAHCLIHTGEKPIVCEMCGRTFRQQASLWTHNILHHGKGKKVYRCDLCGKVSRTSSHLTKHKRVHDQNRAAAATRRKRDRNETAAPKTPEDCNSRTELDQETQRLLQEGALEDALAVASIQFDFSADVMMSSELVQRQDISLEASMSGYLESGEPLSFPTNFT